MASDKAAQVARPQVVLAQIARRLYAKLSYVTLAFLDALVMTAHGYIVAKLTGLQDSIAATGSSAWPCQLAASGVALASRDMVLSGDSGTPLSQLTETTACQLKSSGGAWYADPQRDSAIPWAGCWA